MMVLFIVIRGERAVNRRLATLKVKPDADKVMLVEVDHQYYTTYGLVRTNLAIWVARGAWRGFSVAEVLEGGDSFSNRQ